MKCDFVFCFRELAALKAREQAELEQFGLELACETTTPPVEHPASAGAVTTPSHSDNEKETDDNDNGQYGTSEALTTASSQQRGNRDNRDSITSPHT